MCLKLRDCLVDTGADAFKELLQLNKIMRQKDQHGVIAGIGPPPTSERTGPADSAHSAAARHGPGFLRIDYRSDTEPVPMTGIEH